MYLLTWTENGWPVGQGYGDFRVAEAEYERNVTRGPVELFERRGNDWIRIRPEEDQ